MVDFPKTNNKVVLQTMGVGKFNSFTNTSNGLATREILEKQALAEHQIIIEKSMLQSEKDYKTKQDIEKVTSRVILESQILNKGNELYKEGKTSVFKEIIFELFRKSLILDEDFVMEHTDNLRDVTNSYIDKNGGFKLLENAIHISSSPLLKNIQTICESISKKVVETKVKQTQETQLADQLTFSLNDEQTKVLDYEKDKLGIDELANLVQKKSVDCCSG